MRHSHLLPILLSGFAAASPLANTGLVTRAGNIVTAEAAIEAIMPDSKSCFNATAPDECRTAKQAAPFLIKAMAGFSIGQIAAMLSLIGVESGQMKFKHNVYPGVEGQGTSNMMSSDFVNEYATSLFGAQAVAGKNKTGVLAMVQPDQYNFGSASWFLREHCTKDVQNQLLGGTDAGFAAYMGCIKVPATDPTRQEFWTRAKKIFGLD